MPSSEDIINTEAEAPNTTHSPSFSVLNPAVASPVVGPGTKMMSETRTAPNGEPEPAVIVRVPLTLATKVKAIAVVTRDRLVRKPGAVPVP